MNLNYKELSDKAYNFHKNNDFKNAELLYLKLLEIKPDDVNILNLTGMLYLSKNQISNAITYLTNAFVLKKTAYIASNLAKAYYMNNEYSKSIKMYKQALQFGENDDIYYSLALAYKKAGKTDNVIECYKKAINLNSSNYNALYNLTIAYKDANDTDNAILCAKKCLAIKADDEDIYAMMSGFYEESGDLLQAVDSLKRAILFNNKNYLYFYNLGVLLSRLKMRNESILAFERAIELNSGNIESYVNLASIYKGTDNNKALELLQKAYKLDNLNENVLLSLAQTYRDLFDNDSSIKTINQILSINQNCAEAYSLLAMNYMDESKYKDALDLYNKALELDNENFNYLHGKAVALKYLEKIQEAKEILEYIAKYDECSVQSKVTLGMMYLTEKDFEKGMNLYTKRSLESKFKDVFHEKIWSKGKVVLKDKNVLVYSDCGLGDTIMCSRFLPELKKENKSVTLQTDKELINILQNSFEGINVIKKGIAPPDYDVVIPVMDLQYALDINFNKIDSMPYLKVSSDDILKFSQLDIIKDKKNKTGLFWQGNKRIFKNRSISFDTLKSLFSVKNASFYSFQIDFDINENENIFNLKQYINDYSDTAALLKNMDLLITIDSSIAHMAGALGINTWLLLPKIAEWRWFNDFEKTIWYNNVRIFRQSHESDWHSVIQKVKKELENICK